MEYKISKRPLSSNRKAVTFSDKKGIGTLKLKETYNLNYYQLKQHACKCGRCVVLMATMLNLHWLLRQFVRKLAVGAFPTPWQLALLLGAKLHLLGKSGNQESPHL